MDSRASTKGTGFDALAVPAPPTAAERSVRQLTHLPFQQWCELCVAGKAKGCAYNGACEGSPARLRDKPVSKAKGARITFSSYSTHS